MFSGSENPPRMGVDPEKDDNHRNFKWFQQIAWPLRPELDPICRAKSVDPEKQRSNGLISLMF